MNGTCCGGTCSSDRAYLTKEEKIEMLKEYEESLQQEAKGVRERIEEISKQ